MVLRIIDGSAPIRVRVSPRRLLVKPPVRNCIRQLWFMDYFYGGCPLPGCIWCSVHASIPVAPERKLRSLLANPCQRRLMMVDVMYRCVTAQIEDGPRNESRTHGIGFADRSVDRFAIRGKTVQGGISTREPYPRQRISFLPLSMIYRGRSPPRSRTLSPFPETRPRPSGPPSRCRPVGVSIRFIHPLSVDANKEDSGNLV